MTLETVTPLTDNAEGFDIVSSAWKHAAVVIGKYYGHILAKCVEDNAMSYLTQLQPFKWQLTD